MKRWPFAGIGLIWVIVASPLTAGAEAECTLAEVQAVEAMLTTKTAALRGQDVQAPRGQDVQAPRSLASTGQEVQAPRGQEVQAPRTGSAASTVMTSTVDDARRFAATAKAACEAGDIRRATAYARAAMELLKYLP
ncbi:MAG TPA: hypothetical protein DCQ64_19410 [Candidatus Rokubacteria bacterium]|nr:hypothetical protein [Candidatus Rokubacteria bacterium]